MFIMGVDLGQAQDYTAICILERKDATVLKPRPHVERAYELRYLQRPPLGTKYTTIVAQVIGLLDRAPLHRRTTPLVVDRTGVGRGVVDMFTAAGVRPRAITITGGDAVVKDNPYDLRVPKRELAATLVACYQTQRLKTSAGLELAATLTNELLNFRVKINIATSNDSYEAWRESVHDDLVLSVAMAVWYGEHVARGSTGPPAVWGGERTIIAPWEPPAGADRPLTRRQMDDLLRGKSGPKRPWFERLPR
jgi:hypothetical protein